MTSRKMSKSRSSRVSTTPSQDCVALVLTVRPDVRPPNATSGRGRVRVPRASADKPTRRGFPSHANRLEESNERRNTRSDGACTIGFYRRRRPSWPIAQPRPGVGHPPTAPFLRAWWTDLPDDYVAKDPREQPHRIRVLVRYPDRIELVGTWRGPLGKEMLLPETLRVRQDGSWTFDARPMGLRVHDEFQASPSGDGTRLHIRTVITPAGAWGRIVARLMGGGLLRLLEKRWPTPAAICERDAP